MKHVVLASTSTLYGDTYLAYLQPVMKHLFAGIREIVFIPYARPGGISHDDYTAKAAAAFAPLGITVRGLHTFDDPAAAIRNAEGFFTGGGNTFLLVKVLLENSLMSVLKETVESGRPYMGCSAGSNIGGISMQTTNDMPIVYPPGFQTMGLVPFNLNPHYLDPVPDLPHMGETRETRIREFHTQHTTPVVGLREGSWIHLKGENITLEGPLTARIFEAGKEPYEIPAGSSLAQLG
ncbi:MAG TPA: dipeptidase PepE [Chitinophaga sp.]|uniref:dipeptidase PepE n=1 Tax=Chitinophaga sp. TaxID=1869181 RepID=UPI002C71CE24|nr:dipeptidase PepE [Chitinophaga sp.]HVI47169.1 dipeptidase PepE [Chitinophaga sp.]